MTARCCASSSIRWMRWLLALLVLFLPHLLSAQLDQGALVGTVTDPQGAVVPHAAVQLRNLDTNFTVQAATDDSGVYVFQPIKVGHYAVTVTAQGFATETKTGLEVQVGGRLQANIHLKVGSTTESVSVNADDTPLMQTQDASTGQTMTQQQINAIPLNQRNYVFLAQLSSGVTNSNGSRGQGNGDFIANGQRATQNNFILDGVDNNANSIDFLNGASYNVKPPPDALQEFSVVTSDSSAQFGHSAGAVVNASIKSGTNQFHGDVWEYIRNNDLGQASPTEWASGVTSPTTVQPYHQNQFGFTFGGPFIRNKLFFFGDYEGNRIIEDSPSITSVPTALMRSDPGNFSEELTPNLNGLSTPRYIYEPHSDGGATGTDYLGSACGNAINVMCASEISPIAEKIFLAAYPAPNTGPAGQTYNNYAWSQATTDNTNQFDVRVDYNLSAKDQIFGRVSWSHEDRYVAAPLGPVFDGGGTDNDGYFKNYDKNAVFSWNHVFSPNFVNQARFSYNWGLFSWYQQSYNNGSLDAEYGLGGLAPYDASKGNGGLAQIYTSEFNEIGPPNFQPSPEGQNVYQIIDDATRVLGNHSLKFGVEFQNIRYSVYQPTFGTGAYNYGGTMTALSGSATASGFGPADFFADTMSYTYTSDPTPTNNGHWYRAAYLQDDWKVSQKLTVGLGLRYDFFSSPVERNDKQAEFYPTSATNAPGASGMYIFPKSQEGIALSSSYTSALAADNITLGYTGDRGLVTPQHMNFAPRIGISYSPSDRIVFRSGFGIYYGGAENLGNYVNLGANYPYDIEQEWYITSCTVASCPDDTIKLATGPAAGASALTAPTLTGWDRKVKTSYTMNQNLSVQYGITHNTTATISYVGAESRHLADVVWPDGWTALEPPGVSGQATEPYPTFNGNIHQLIFGAIGNYNSLQAKLERRFSNGLSFLTSYTWAHSLDDAREPLPSNNDGGDRMYPVFGVRIDYGNSPFDVREKFNLSGTYELPFGVGRKYLNHRGWADTLAGGWDATALFRTQDGFPFTVSSNTSTVNGAGAYPYLISDPFKGGGTAPASNPTITCPAKVRTRANWYNPCAFADPPLASSVTQEITGAANILPYLGSPRSQISGPGWQRVDMTLTKNFTTFREQYLQFRADVYNLFNTPAWGTPSNTSTSNIGGQITGTAFLGNYSPDPRFLQLALKYYF
ncbi:TonB-dependent receptor [Silvibacterium dinghuense]|uniref:TonB-dependent receptor n=1 Tax=Silvibacterium dinghuense TaxID=1560006 RepID=A0A4Q1SJ07_9BACT|nr:carboxypeptidase regulatory-like domain-containing protein [Silvibacterium dinghuense]RXS97618.1 TonB-dependent receptor [Silvibacterium dinghuense]